MSDIIVGMGVLVDKERPLRVSGRCRGFSDSVAEEMS